MVNDDKFASLGENNMETFAEFLKGIDNPEHQERTEEVLAWVAKKFPNLNKEIKWNQPMFTDHGTYIIGFSVSKKHLAVAPEQAGMNRILRRLVMIILRS